MARDRSRARLRPGSTPLTPAGLAVFHIVHIVAVWAALSGSGCGTGGAKAGAAGGAGGALGGGTGGGGACPPDAGTSNRDLDLVFVVGDSGADLVTQHQFYMQIPTFIEALESPDGALPNLHVAVVSGDMGAPGAPTGICTGGDAGQFRAGPMGPCANTTLASGASFIVEDGATKNFTQVDMGNEPGLAVVLQCVSLLGEGGCAFTQPLAALDRALGADGASPPPANAGFLRPDAFLAIIFIAAVDDCSAPADTQLYSLADPNIDDLSDPHGPLSTYRCNRYGHLCTDAAGQQVMPPLEPPAGVIGSPVPDISFSACQSNDASGLTTPVSKFVADIKALKPHPASQILAASIGGPVSPYVVAWQAGIGGAGATEQWPFVTSDCGGSGAPYAEPAVRLAQFVQGFGPNANVASACAPSYGPSLVRIASAIKTMMSASPPPGCGG